MLTINKQCQPANDDGRFTLDLNEATFAGMRCGQSTGPITVAVGTHLVGEVATPPTIAGNYSTEFGGACDPSGKLTLTANQHATCTVTNTRIKHPPPPRPPNECYELTVAPRKLPVGRRGRVQAQVAVRGRPVPDVLVRLSGAGISRARHTGTNGAAQFVLVPKTTGTIRVTTPHQFG